MRKPTVLSVFFFIAILMVSCDESTTVEQINSIKTVSERIGDLNKSVAVIKEFEDQDALSREENQFLEYDYPIREDESYVVAYRFFDDACFEIGITTYFNQEKDAQKVKKAVIKELAENANFGQPTKEIDFYKWCSTDDVITIELDVRNIERGTVVLSVFSNR